MGERRRRGGEGGGEASWYLNGEDLHGHVLAQQLRLPHAAKAPPSFHLDELQGLMSQDGGRGRWSGILRGGVGGEEEEKNWI